MSGALTLDGEAFTALARARLRPTPPERGDVIRRLRGDHEYQDEPMAAPDENGAIPAAVLVPVVMHRDGPSVILTRRAATLRSHSAQVAFPGGRVDATDGTPLVTALRETEEEIGLARGHVTTLGYLDAYLTGTGYRIVPVVGLVTPPFHLTLNPHEVDIAFEAPLSFLLDPANHERHAREFRGRQRSYYAISYGDHYIWGATAGIVRNLYESLAG